LRWYVEFVPEQRLSRRRNAGGRETELRLVLVAERLFAEQGIDSVSLRQIGAAAGVRMPGVVAYYFGDKDGLIRAIIAHRIPLIAERRKSLLDDLEQHGRVRDVRGLVEAVVLPAVETIGDVGFYWRFRVQLNRHPARYPQGITALVDDALRDQFPPEILELRKRFASNVLVATLADLEAEGGIASRETVISELIECLVAIYAMAPSRQTIDALLIDEDWVPAGRPKRGTQRGAARKSAAALRRTVAGAEK
jgi:AcrR family transcriptional regulator